MAANDLYEVLDDKGLKTGKLLDLATIHKQQLWHEVVNLWVMNTQGEILMQLRAPSVELAPGVWDVTVGTHLRPSEDPTVAAAHALKDGLGVEIATEEMKHLFNIQCANPMPNGTLHKVLGHVFMVVRDLEINELTFDTAKVARFAWVPLTALMAEVGSSDTKSKYFPRAGNYYSQLFVAFESWM